MPQTSPYQIVLSDEDHATLLSRSRQYTRPHYQVIRAKMILLAAEGKPNDQIADKLDVPRKTVSRSTTNPPMPTWLIVLVAGVPAS
ncbi:MAG: helix-turn-helix domain-containing protein [Candidatus Latescibacteria bacterium]|nr:helix-turn-helix domain-containing protein [Candidatus Latescibacterota bacterium]